jgi:hypothetical protein
MANYFEKVKNYLIELDLPISFEDAQDEVFIINKEDAGITDLVIGVAEPILIMEQSIFEIPEGKNDVYKRLLQLNGQVVHGAFVLDEESNRVVFRDTLQLENLDLNEIEASINSISLMMAEFSDEIINLSKN